ARHSVHGFRAARPRSGADRHVVVAHGAHGARAAFGPRLPRRAHDPPPPKVPRPAPPDVHDRRAPHAAVGPSRGRARRRRMGIDVAAISASSAGYGSAVIGSSSRLAARPRRPRAKGRAKALTAGARPGILPDRGSTSG